MKYAIKKEVPHSYEDTIEKVTATLKEQGFGILTEIDVKATLKKKIDVDIDKYIILGACNPPFAHRALQAEDDIGLLLPCNVVVYEKDDKTNLAAFDPQVMSSISDNAEINQLAGEVREKLKAAVEAV